MNEITDRNFNFYYRMQVGKDIWQAKQLLENNELVAIPTETVYGLAANGLNRDAVIKIFEAKNRPAFNPLILHVSGLDKIKPLVKRIPEKAYLLAKNFWPGPLTLILPKKDIVPDIVTAGLDTVGIRIPSHPLTLELLQSLDFPLAAPSANMFGYVSPIRPEHVIEQMGDKVAYVLDGGPCMVGIESTIVKVTGDDVFVLRLGGVSVEEIEEVAGDLTVVTGDDENPEAPGMLTAHYAPNKKLVIGNIRRNLEKYDNKKVGIISYQQKFKQVSEDNQYVLSPDGDLRQAARNIFDALRKMDGLDLDVILAEYLPDLGLGKAINDRLKRASAK